MTLPQRLTALLLLFCVCLPATSLDDEHWKKANASIEKGIAYLRAQQAEDGSWMPDMGPAVTGLALTALLEQPNIGPDDETAAKAIAYILNNVQDDGSIRKGPDGILASYNTALSLSALARIGGSNPEAASAIKGGQEFLKGTQWIVGMKDPDGKTIDEDHPFFGGFGYGGSGRPDISNTQLALQALHDTGVDCEDPAFKRALTFLNRIQAVESNDKNADKFEELDGGFIYSSSIDKDHIGVPESKASQDQIDEGKAGRKVSGLRTYGSVTYAGFKSMIYANLDREDPRMKAALSWISKNYTLAQNPGMPEKQKLQGLFYYYLTMGRALNAYGNSTLTVGGVSIQGTVSTGDRHGEINIVGGLPEGVTRDRIVIQETIQIGNSAITQWVPLTDEKVAELIHEAYNPPRNGGSAFPENSKIKPLITGRILNEAGDGVLEDIHVNFVSDKETRDWANDLIDVVVSQQHEEGWWANEETRWLESQPVLVTAYSVIALQNAID